MPIWRISKLVPAQSGLVERTVIDVNAKDNGVLYMYVSWNGEIYACLNYSFWGEKATTIWIVRNGQLVKLIEVPYWLNVYGAVSIPNGCLILPAHAGVATVFSSLVTYWPGNTNVNLLCGDLEDVSTNFVGGNGANVRFAGLFGGASDSTGRTYWADVGANKLTFVKAGLQGEAIAVHEIQTVEPLHLYFSACLAMDESGTLYADVCYVDYVSLTTDCGIYKIVGPSLYRVATIGEDANYSYVDGMHVTRSGQIIAACMSTNDFVNVRMTLWSISPSGQKSTLYSTGWVANGGMFYSRMDRFGNIYVCKQL